MALCHQATSHYLSQCWLSPLSPYGIARPQWIKAIKFGTNVGLNMLLNTSLRFYHNRVDCLPISHDFDLRSFPVKPAARSAILKWLFFIFPEINSTQELIIYLIFPSRSRHPYVLYGINSTWKNMDKAQAGGKLSTATPANAGIKGKPALHMVRVMISLITRFMGLTWGLPEADRTQVGPMLAPWSLLSARYQWHSARLWYLQCVQLWRYWQSCTKSSIWGMSPWFVLAFWWTQKSLSSLIYSWVTGKTCELVNSQVPEIWMKF